MSILVNKNTRVVVQGITGKEGSFHATQCKAYGTKMVAGVTPGKAGQEVEGIPVFNTVVDAVKKTECDTSLIFVPPPFCRRCDIGSRRCRSQADYLYYGRHSRKRYGESQACSAGTRCPVNRSQLSWSHYGR